MKLEWGLTLLFFLLIPSAYGYDRDKCSSANASVQSASSELSAATTAYDYCIRWGDTAGTGYGSTDCDSAYNRKVSAQSDYDSALSSQWHYCY